MALQGIFFSSPQLQKQYNAATSKQDQYKANGIMNNAFSDYPAERPYTSSFIGSNSSVFDPHLDQDVYNANRPPKASYLYKEKPVEPQYVYRNEAPRRPTTISTSASTVGFLPPKKKQRSIRGKTCVLLLLLLCFIILSIVMIVLYAEKNEQGSEGKTNGNNQPLTGAPPTKKKLDCRPLPKPVAFNSLPANVLTELSSLESLINSEVANEGPKAVSVNIVYMDKVIWQKEFGVMNNSETNKRKPTSNTTFPIASVSKVLTTLMLYKLYSQGFVRSLDDPVTNYQFDFSVKNPFNNAPITLRQLASHRSGLPREAPCFPDTKDNLCPYTQDQMIQRLKNTTLLNEPGKEPQYSNLGFALLGRVLGTRFGRFGGGFEEWMRDNLLVTLGMTDTTFNLDASLKQRIPVGYLSKKGEFHRVLEWGWLNPGGGAFSTVADLAKLEIALFREGSSNRYLPRGYTDSFFAPGYILPDGEGDVVGTPWEMKILDDMVIREKRGYVYGYDSIVSILPEMKLAMNILCTNCRARLLAERVRSSFITKILPAFKEALNNVQIQKIVNPPDTKPFLGVFLVEGIPTINHMEAKIKDGHIHLLLDGRDDIFILNYTQPETFKIIIPANFPCFTAFTLGVNQDLVVYDSPSKVDGLSDRFTMYGAHPSGRTYFYRNRTSSST